MGSSADKCGGSLFCSDAVAGFHVDDCRETEMWFECLKEIVIVHCSYLKDQYHIIFLTFLCSQQRSEQVVVIVLLTVHPRGREV